jgi:hypothetical protein
VMVRMVLGGNDPDTASVTVPATPGVHVMSSVYVAVSPGSTEIVSPVPPDAGGGTVSVNPAPIPPTSVTVCCDPGVGALSVIVSVAVSIVVTVGVNVTVIVQLESAPMPPSLALQLSFSLKSAAFGPVIVIPVMFSPMFTLDDTVTGIVGLGCVPTGTAPKLMFMVERLTVTVAPVPESMTVCGLFDALSVTVSVAVFVPSGAAGLNVTVMVHVRPAASVAGAAGQVFICENAAAFAPVIVNAPLAAKVSGPGPEFVSVSI